MNYTLHFTLDFQLVDIDVFFCYKQCYYKHCCLFLYIYKVFILIHLRASFGYVSGTQTMVASTYQLILDVFQIDLNPRWQYIKVSGAPYSCQLLVLSDYYYFLIWGLIDIFMLLRLLTYKLRAFLFLSGSFLTSFNKVCYFSLDLFSGKPYYKLI